MTFAGIWSERWPIPRAWRALSMTRSGRWRMRLASSRAGTPSRMRPSRIRNAGPPALRTPVWPLPTRLCRLLTPSRVWGATIPAPVAAARSSRSAAWTEGLSGRRSRACCDESARQTGAIRRSSDPFSLATLTIFRRCPHVKKQLWGGEFWTDGYFASTVGRHANEAIISDYVKKQGQEYQKLHESRQLALF